MTQTAVEWLEKEIENISIQVFDGFLTFTEFMEERENLCNQAKKMEKSQCQDYARFAIECDRKDLPILDFNGYSNLIK